MIGKADLQQSILHFFRELLTSFSKRESCFEMKQATNRSRKTRDRYVSEQGRPLLTGSQGSSRVYEARAEPHSP